MKIKKVDDKPMVIHSKEKPKIRMHESKDDKIKGHNVYAVERYTGSKSNSDKQGEAESRGKESFRKSTVHQNKQSKLSPIAQYKQKWKDYNSSVKVKNSTIKMQD